MIQPTINSNRFKKPLDIFWPEFQRKGSEEYLVMIFAVNRKLWAIFLPRVHLEKEQTPGAGLKHKKAYAYLTHDFQRHFTLNTSLREWKSLSLYMFHRIIFIWLIVSSPSRNFYRASIKLGTWNIPEHAGTSRNIPEHPGTSWNMKK